MNKFVILAWVVVNIITYFIYAADKKRAVKGKRRISEQTLLTLVLVGGAVGALFAMLAHHHKTSKSSFMVKYFSLVVFQTVVVYFILKQYH